MRNQEVQKEQLNLARKWRSKNFDQIIGQDLSVKILKNSLYLDRIFPVYLFAGQRGCGKTTTARVFAAAINCEQLEAFRAEPKKELLPCNQCASCVAFLNGSHPDFIEMDAASHTGVENVRNIVDAATLLPVMSKKKIYLIDEAHMLSRAAFNAFLKILEEPPASVLFILATTDTEKIIETVRSRCFQLFFDPVNTDPLCAHLQHICAQEGIVADIDALTLVVQETDGSVRDAINLLERIRFSHRVITKEVVQESLGHVSDELLIKLLDIVLHGSSVTLLHHYQQASFSSASALFVWRRFVDLLRAAIWLKNGVKTDLFAEHEQTIRRTIQKCSWVKLNNMLHYLYTHEEIFKRTTAQHSFFEMILLHFCSKSLKSSSSDNDSSSSSVPSQALPVVPEESSLLGEDELQDEQESDDEQENEWAQFVLKLSELQEPILLSVFKQVQSIQHDKMSKKVTVSLIQDLHFFSDTISQLYDKWYPVLQSVYGKDIAIEYTFNASVQKSEAVQKKVEPSTPAAQNLPSLNDDIGIKKRIENPRAHSSYPQGRNNNYKRKAYRETLQVSGKKVDSSVLASLPHTAMIVSHFPGTVYEIEKS